jgi:hypothetical protein
VGIPVLSAGDTQCSLFARDEDTMVDACCSRFSLILGVVFLFMLVL